MISPCIHASAVIDFVCANKIDVSFLLFSPLAYRPLLAHSFPKPEVLDGVEVDGVLTTIAAFLDMLIKNLFHRLTKRCKEGLLCYIKLVVMPVCNGYTFIYSK